METSARKVNTDMTVLCMTLSGSQLSQRAIFDFRIFLLFFFPFFFWHAEENLQARI